MRVVVLGYGGWVSNPTYGHTSILVTSETGSVLLDAGEGVFRDLFECGYSDLKRIKAIVLTHGHGDHTLGLPTIAQFAKVFNARLLIVGLEKTLTSLVEILRATSVSNYECCLEFVPVKHGDVVEVAGIKMEFAEVPHTIPSIAVRVEESGTGRCLTYSGDTSYSEELVRLAEGCDLLMHEASFSDTEASLARSLGHSTVSDCIRVGVEAKNRLIVPLHFGLEEPRIDLTSLPKSITVVYPAKCLTIDV
ncbi:MAG: ribonuclease Z [Sulfolobales archaeon]